MLHIFHEVTILLFTDMSSTTSTPSTEGTSQQPADAEKTGIMNETGETGVFFITISLDINVLTHQCDIKGSSGWGISGNVSKYKTAFGPVNTVGRSGYEPLTSRTRIRRSNLLLVFRRLGDFIISTLLQLSQLFK